MLDIRLLRDKPELVKMRLATRGSEWDGLVDAALTSDAKRREAETRLQSLQAERNRLSRQVGAMRSQGLDTASIEAQVSAQSAEMQALSRQATLLDEEQRELLLSLPNLPQENVPIGADSSHNPVVRTWGERPRLARTEDHRTIGSRLDLFDFDRAARMSGGGFVSYKGRSAPRTCADQFPPRPSHTRARL
jgi:seryl-tRNA synthetase